jgi:CubicO group peptidase (beta-lactamase class C family)
MRNTNSKRILYLYGSILLVLLIYFFLFLQSDIPAQEKTSKFVFNPQSEYWPTKDWKKSSPERQGMNSEPLVDIFRDINNNNIDIYSILVVRNGYIVVEANKHNYIQQIFSSTKSFTSAIFGIALSKGYIKNINLKVIDFFPEFLQKDKISNRASITLKHLLTMSSGIEWPEVSTNYSNPENLVSQMMRSENYTEFILSKPVMTEPGLIFNYNSGCANLLVSVLNKLGLDVEDFAQKNLFTPLGISSDQYVWSEIQKGIPNGSHGLSMKPRDMAKFGYLYLKGGFWDGQQIIPKTWIEESTKEQIKISGPLSSYADSYGYQWYIHSFGFHSLGWKGQYIFVIPKHELVVVFTSDLLGPRAKIPINLVKNNIIPAIQTLVALPENKKVLTELKSEIDKFEKNE